MKKQYITLLNENIERKAVQYKNRYGMELAGELYTEKDMDLTAKYPAIIVGAPYGGVKEQGPCVYADVIVMASPVYFYSIDAQMKTVIDRSLARWTNIPNKEFYYIMTAAENSDAVMDCSLECFRGFALCLSGAVEKGVIYGKGVYEAGLLIYWRAPRLNT